MEATAASAALEGRYAVLLHTAAGLGTEELLEVIEEAHREKDAASARQAVALAHLSAREPHLQEDGTTVEVHRGVGHQRMDAPELAAPRMGVSVHVATRRVSQAIDQLSRTPEVIDAMACGDLDEQRAAAVTEETEFLTPESAAAVVGLVAPRWSGLTVGPLRRLLARAAAIVDPDAVAAHADDERSRRGLTRRVGSHGTDAWRGEFLVEQSRAAWAAVTELARQKVRDGSAATLELARADALMELVLGHCDVSVVVHTTRAATDTDDPTASPAAPQETSPATARDADGSAAADAAAAPTGGHQGASGDPSGLGEVGGLGAPGTTFVPRAWLDRLHASSVDPGRELTCHHETGALLAGDVPEALASGRTTRSRTGRCAEDPTQSYRIPAAMARLVRLRDGSCRFPGCSTPTRHCDLDHVRPWPAGPTAPTNLIALCRRHHRVKQRPGWTVHLHPDGRVTWHDPTGRAHTTWAVDHLHLATATRSSTSRTSTSASPSTSATSGGAAGREQAEPSSTFEDELAALLDTHAIPPRRTYPRTWDARGHPLSGPPPRVDLSDGRLRHRTTGRRHTVVLDRPTRPAPPRDDSIPF